MSRKHNDSIDKKVRLLAKQQRRQEKERRREARRDERRERRAG